MRLGSPDFRMAGTVWAHNSAAYLRRSSVSRMRMSRFCEAASSNTDRKSTGLNSSHLGISYAVFCLKKKVQDRANNLLRAGNREVKRIPYEKAIKAPSTRQKDFVLPYVRDLKNVVDMDAIRDARVNLAVDPLGGAALPYWEPISSIYGLDITVRSEEHTSELQSLRHI